jgi:hypothetical protein
MNDFTKEELIIMYHNFSETEFRGANTKLNRIRQKIQSMIDNYCDHNQIIQASERIKKKYAKALEGLKNK